MAKQLARATEVTANSLAVLFNGYDYEAVDIIAFAKYVNGLADYPAQKVRQIETPNASAFTLLVPAKNTWLIIQSPTTRTSGAIRLPLEPIDGQEVLVTSLWAVTNLTIDAQGKNKATSVPTTIAPGGFFTLKFDLNQGTWWRVG